jgi:hypothetical protein
LFLELKIAHGTKFNFDAISFAHFGLFEIELPIRYIGNVGRLFSNPNGTEFHFSK